MLTKSIEFLKTYAMLLAILFYFVVLYFMPADSPLKGLFGYVAPPVIYFTITFISSLDFSSKYLASTLMGLHIPFLLVAMFYSPDAAYAVLISAFFTYFLTYMGITQFFFSKIFR